MVHGQTVLEKRKHRFIQHLLVPFILLSLVSANAQTQRTGTIASVPSNDMDKYPGLLPAFEELFQKIEQGVQFPPARTQSRILPLLPQPTIFYMAMPNVGDASNQAWGIFQNELQQNPVLQNWWQQGPLANNKTQIENGWKKFYQLSQYLGDEVVISATRDGNKDPEPLMIAEIRKPGLKQFLQQALLELAEKPTPDVHIIDSKELASLKSKPQQLLILVRSDFLVVASDATMLRLMNTRLDLNSQEFASTGFGHKLVESYGNGISAMGGIDLQKIISQLPKGDPKSEATFQNTGFSEAKYLIWKHRDIANIAASEMELSFTGPRRGVAAWLATPGTMESLDYMSPNAVLATVIRLNDPARMFDDIKALAGPDSPAFTGIQQMEGALHLSLKDDVFHQLTGEVALELDSVSQPAAQWKVLLRVNDAAKLQTTLNTLMVQMGFRTEEFEEDNTTYHLLRVPAANKATQLAYAFVDNYFIIASSRHEIAEAVRLHKIGESLKKSQKFLAALPPEHGAQASAIFYEDPAALAAMNLTRLSAVSGAGGLLPHPSENHPMVVCAYGEESAIREASRSAGVDTGAVLIIAAIAIPNLLRARIAANDASAVSNIRTINTAEVSYVTAYPNVGYARDLARLGVDPVSVSSISAEHAGMMDITKFEGNCKEGTWCTKSGFKFSISATCTKSHCENYVATATPVSASTGSRSFCSTSDAVVRYKLGGTLLSPASAAECRTWLPLQ